MDALKIIWLSLFTAVFAVSFAVMAWGLSRDAAEYDKQERELLRRLAGAPAVPEEPKKARLRVLAGGKVMEK